MELVNKLAALMFYDTGEKTSFEKLPDDVKKKWIKKAENTILSIDKLNMKIVNKVVEKYGDKPNRIDKIKAVIMELHKGINFKKLNQAENYPTEELANRLEELWTSN